MCLTGRDTVVKSPISEMMLLGNTDVSPVVGDRVR